MAPLRKGVANYSHYRLYASRSDRDFAIVYVCLCNALTEDDINQAASRDGATRPAAVFEACRCRAQCGTCVRSICSLLGFGSASRDTGDLAGTAAA